MTHNQVQNQTKQKKSVSYAPQIHISQTKHRALYFFKMYVAFMHCLNYNGQESKKQFAVYDSDTPVTLKYGQSHQTWYKLVDPKKGYNHAKIERPQLTPLNEATVNEKHYTCMNWSIY